MTEEELEEEVKCVPNEEDPHPESVLIKHTNFPKIYFILYQF